MPYRKLPVSDAGRIEALRATKTKADATPATELAFSNENPSRLNTFYPSFLKEVEERGTAFSLQTEATSGKYTAEENCKLLTSHFYQVFNLGIARGKYKVSERAFFNLGINQETIPELSGQESIRTWAENIIKGDLLRVAAGGLEMTNPSKADVEATYNDYITKINDQSLKKDQYEKEQKDVDKLRAEADDLIKDIWDEIEFKYRKDEPSAMRRKAREYGIVYVSRPGEPEEEVKTTEQAVAQPT